MSQYWKTETPTFIVTSRNTLQYYREAEKLSVSKPMWTDDKGAERIGKTVVLDLMALHESEDLCKAREIFADILNRIDERMELM